MHKHATRDHSVRSTAGKTVALILGAIVVTSALALGTWRHAQPAAHATADLFGAQRPASGRAGANFSGLFLRGEGSPERTQSAIVLWTLGPNARTDQSTFSVFGSVQHAPFSVVRGDATFDLQDAYVVADQAPGDFGAALFHVTQGSSTLLTEHAVHAGRPLVDSDGRVFVEVGAEGLAPNTVQDPGAGASMRIDALRILAFAPGGTAPVTLITDSGFALHIAGSTQTDLLVYRVRDSAAEIVRVSKQTHAVYTIATIAAFARDFSNDETHLVYSNRATDDQDTWLIESLDLATGVRTTLATQAGDAQAPLLLQNGDVALAAKGRIGLAFASTRSVLAPFGAGFDAPEDEGASFLLVRHQTPGGFDARYLVGRDETKSIRKLVSHDLTEPLRLLGSRNGGVR